MRAWAHRAVLSSILIGLLLIPQATKADEDVFSANWVMPGCRLLIAPQPGDDFKQGVCADISSTLLDLDRQFGVCAPKDVTEEQVVRVIVAYIDARPARLNEPEDIDRHVGPASAHRCRCLR